MRMSRQNVVVAMLAAAVIGLGAVVAADHLGAGPANAPAAPATFSAADLAFSPTSDFAHLGQRGHGKLLQKLAGDMGVPLPTVLADLAAGETLNQIAGANAAKVQGDILGAVRAALDRAASTGAISPAQETRLLNDASDAVSVAMNAKLGDLREGR